MTAISSATAATAATVAATGAATATSAAAAATTSSSFGDLSKLPHDSRQGNIIACSVLSLLFAGLFVAARFYTRMFITRTRLGASEWLVLIAWVFSIGVTVPAVLQTNYGMGVHYYDLAEGEYNASAIAESELISILFYSLSLTFSKLSVLVLYVLVFNYNWVRTVSFALLAVVSISQIWMCYVIFSACTPLEAFWDTTIVGATCHPQPYWLANQYQLIATDFLIFLLPLPVVWRLKVRPGQKILLVFVFAMGFFTCAISIIRIELIMPLTANPGPDFTYVNAVVYYWTDVETNLAITVASSLTLKPFISRLIPRSLSGRSSDNDNDNIENGNGGHDSGNKQKQQHLQDIRGNNGTSGRIRRSIFDPILTFGSRPSRRPSSHLDDTQALRTEHSRTGSQSTSDLGASKSIHSRVNEDTGPHTSLHDVPLSSLPPKDVQ